MNHQDKRDGVGFTPGPWRMWTSNSFRRISSDVTGGDGDVLCAVTQPSDGHPDLHFKNGGFEGPDAKLILAAPELYEAANDALSILVRIIEGKEWGAIEDYAESLRSALSRARGEAKGE